MKKTILTLAAILTTIIVSAANYDGFYKNLPINIQQVEQPKIKEARINVKEYGAVGNGVFDCTAIIQKAIDDLSAKGGGHVVIPSGLWVTAPLNMKSGIDLHISRNAVLLITPDRTKHFKPGVRKPMSAITATGCTNISITGSGVIDGNGEYWRAAKRSKLSNTEWEKLKTYGGTITNKGEELIWFPYNLNNLPNFAESMEAQESLRTSLVKVTNCQKVLIKDVTLRDAPKFHLEIEDCNNLVVDNIRIRGPWNAQNGDGIDLKTSQNVLICNNIIDCGDDGIVLKAATGKKAFDHKAIENVVITRNIVYNAHGGFVIGSEFSSGVKRVCVYDNSYIGTETGLRFKSFTGRGGQTEAIYIWNIEMTDISEDAIIFETDYINEAIHKTEGAFGSEWVPEFKDIHISNVNCNSTVNGISARGAKGTVHDVEIKDCSIVYTKVNTDIDPNCDIRVSNVQMTQLGAAIKK